MIIENITLSGSIIVIERDQTDHAEHVTLETKPALAPLGPDETFADYCERIMARAA